MPPKIRKAVITIMDRSLKPQKLTAGKMITLSMYTFGQVRKQIYHLKIHTNIILT